VTLPAELTGIGELLIGNHPRQGKLHQTVQLAPFESFAMVFGAD
jgi:hypothetical protein